MLLSRSGRHDRQAPADRDAESRQPAWCSGCRPLSPSLPSTARADLDRVDPLLEASYHTLRQRCVIECGRLLLSIGSRTPEKVYELAPFHRVCLLLVNEEPGER